MACSEDTDPPAAVILVSASDEVTGLQRSSYRKTLENTVVSFAQIEVNPLEQLPFEIENPNSLREAITPEFADIVITSRLGYNSDGQLSATLVTENLQTGESSKVSEISTVFFHFRTDDIEALLQPHLSFVNTIQRQSLRAASAPNPKERPAYQIPMRVDVQERPLRVEISVELPDDLIPDVEAVQITYTVNGGANTSRAADTSGVSGNLYAVAVPAEKVGPGDLLEYRAEVRTVNGLRFRATDVESASVDGSTVIEPGDEGNLRVLRWYGPVPNFEADGSTTGLLYDNGTLYRNVDVKTVGASARDWAKHPKKFEFPDSQQFELFPETYEVGEFRLNSPFADKSYLRMILSSNTYTAAGVPSSIVIPVVLMVNNEFFGVYMLTEMVTNNEFLRRNGFSTGGVLFKGEEERIMPRSGVGNTSTVEDIDYTESGFYNEIDIPGLINYLAATTLTGGTDQVWGGNIFFYMDPATELWTVFPWDTDLTFGRNSINPRVRGVDEYVLNDMVWADVDYVPELGPSVYPSHPFVGSRNHVQTDYGWRPIFDTVFNVPAFQELYLRRLRSLMDELLNPPGTPRDERYYEGLIDTYQKQLEGWVEKDREKWGWYGEEQTLQQAVSILERDYLEKRRTHLYINHLAGNPAGWTRNNAGIPESPAWREGPAITEIVHTPRSGIRDQEYVKIVNRSDEAIDLSGWSLTGSISFVFPSGTVVGTIADELFVTPNVIAFHRRTTSPSRDESTYVVGNYRRRLPNSGGVVILQDQHGNPVSGVRYSPKPGKEMFELNLKNMPRNQTTHE